MKKLFVIAALFVSMAAANAQQFGVIGGLNLSKMDGVKNPVENKNMTLFSAGVLYKMDLGAGFAVQPTLTYQVKGAEFKEDVGVLDNFCKSRAGFVELGIGAQWGPDLLAFRPYLFVEPFVGYGVGGYESQRLASADYSNLDVATEARNKLEYGVGAGVGLEIANHVQLSWQLFRNMGKLYQDDKLTDGYKSPYQHLKNYQGMKLSLAILF